VLATARERICHVNALTALLRVADLGADARKALTLTLIAQAVCWGRRDESLAAPALTPRKIRLAKRPIELNQWLKANQADATTRLGQAKGPPAAGQRPASN
jgi:hypothetical protein